MLTTHEAAERLRVTPRTIVRLVKQRKINATKFGRDYMIPADEVDRYAATRRPAGRPKQSDRPIG